MHENSSLNITYGLTARIADSKNLFDTEYKFWEVDPPPMECVVL